VIATHHDPAKFPDHLNRFIRIGTVADNITKIPDDVILWRGCENRLKCGQVCVNVGNDKCSHIQSLLTALVLSRGPGIRGDAASMTAGGVLASATSCFRLARNAHAVETKKMMEYESIS
jgi:hypothetical protein